MDKKATGKKVKKAVKESGKTQKMVADEADMSKDYLHKIKLGIIDPPIRTLARIGHAVGRKLSDLKKQRNGDKKGR